MSLLTMKFKHHATDEIIELEVLTMSTTNETVCKNKETGEILIVFKNKDGKYQIKKTSFIRID